MNVYMINAIQDFFLIFSRFSTIFTFAKRKIKKNNNRFPFRKLSLYFVYL